MIRVAGAGTLAAILLAVATTAAQHGPETFTATASVARGETRASSPITITLDRYSSADDRAAVLAALRDSGTAGARKALSALRDVGAIEFGGRRVAVKFAAARPTSAGSVVTILTAEPMVFLGAGIPGAPLREGYDVAVAILDVRDDGAGVGELAPAAKVGLDGEGALLVHDYGSTVVWLQGLIRAR